MRKEPKWLRVDWVYLGMLGWDIDETGAGFYSVADGLLPDGSSVGHRHVKDSDYIHLDRTTLHVVSMGSLAFLRARIGELEVAGAAGPIWTVTTGSSTANICNTTYWRSA